jgi:hypothetical protein
MGLRNEAWVVCLASVVFEEGQGHSIDSIAPDVLSEADASLLAFLSIPDSVSSASKSVDSLHSFRLRYTSPLPLGSCPLSNHRFSFGLALFRQERCIASVRGATQRSIVVLSDYPLLHLWTKVCTILSYFSDQEPSLIHRALSEIRAWPLLASNPSQVDFFGNTLAIDTVGFREIRLNEVFGEILPALWHLWEALLIGLPILIVCQGDASRASRAVLSCLSLLSPWPYQGDYRPYLPIFDRDYSQFLASPKSCIVGVTSSLAAEQLSKNFALILVLDAAETVLEGKVRAVASTACSLFMSPEVTSRSGGTRSIWSLGSSHHLRLFCNRDDQACKIGSEPVIREIFRKNTETVVKSFNATGIVSETELINSIKIPTKLGSLEMSERKMQMFLENVARGPNLRAWLNQNT